jgi:hypothetical protein
MAVRALEATLQMPVWLLFQGNEISKAFYDARRDRLLPTERIALVIDSNGGMAEDAYEVAKVLQRHCGGFVAVIPRHAKSAATLLSLGADEIMLGKFGELGPLDVQYPDPEREEWISGLDEVQALERLQAFVMSALDQLMLTLCARTSRKVGTMLPHATQLVTEMTRPLFEHIDVFRYSQMSRALKVGEEYARRLLSRRFAKAEATEIARKLVENYPTHSFVIDIDEAKDIGLQLVAPSDEQESLLDAIADSCDGITAIGPLVTKDTNHEHESPAATEAATTPQHSTRRRVGNRNVKKRQDGDVGVDGEENGRPQRTKRGKSPK